MIHNLQMKAVQVWNLAGDMEREDLSLTVNKRLGAERKALQNKAASIGTITAPYDCLVRAKAAGVHRQRSNGSDVVSIEQICNQQLGYQ